MESGFNDRYHRNTNQIPYCIKDSKILANKVLQGDEVTRIDRKTFQAMADLAETFLWEVTSQPKIFVNNLPVMPRVMLANIKEKYPELYPEAINMYRQYLAKWEDKVSKQYTKIPDTQDYNESQRQQSLRAPSPSPKIEAISSEKVQERKNEVPEESCDSLWEDYNSSSWSEYEMM